MTSTINASTSAGIVTTADTSGVLALQTAGTTAVTVDASQNVGIGTATPGYKLDVQSSASSGAPLLANFQAAGGDVQVYIQNGTVKTQINADATNSASIIGSFSNHPLSLRTNNTERMRIDSSGYVGIGTTSLDILDQAGASRPLVVKRSDSSTAINSSTASIAIVNGDTTTSNTAQLNFAAITGANTSGYSSAVISCIFGARTNGQYPTGILTFSTSTLLNAAPTEKMRIDSSGNVIVGGTSTSSDESTYQGGGVFVSRRASSAGTTHANFLNGGSTVGSITSNTTATFYNTTSDYRLKNTIAPMTGALDKVALLKPCTYKWNVDGSDGQGFIAHELQEVIAGCVTGEKDAVETYTDEDGNEATRPVHQGIDTSFLVATLTAAIQEQQALITQLQADVAALKGATP
jgi:hypothetical protein